MTEGERSTPTRVEGSVRILVVEDEAAIADLARRMLEMAGHVVLVASDGEAALEVLEGCEGKIDVVVSDMHMPRLDGEGLYLAALPRYPHLRFIFASGEANLPRSLADADVGILIKPYSSKGLKQAVAAALQS